MLGIWTQIHSTKPVPWNGKFFTVFDEYPLRPSPSPSQMMVLWVQNCDANTNYSDPWFCTSTISLNSTKTFKLGRITVLRVGPTCLVYFTSSSAAPFTVAISQLCCQNIFIAYINFVAIVHLMGLYLQKSQFILNCQPMPTKKLKGPVHIHRYPWISSIDF